MVSLWGQRQGWELGSDEPLTSHSAFSKCNKLHARHGQAEIWLLFPIKVSPAVAWGHCHAASWSCQSAIAAIAALAAVR